MHWILPGTTISVAPGTVQEIDHFFSAMFLAGGLSLGQVTEITGLSTYDIQNWVKRGFLSPPQGKRYSMDQVCRILHIHILRGALPLESIKALLSYINGDLVDESDDIITESQLYFIFVRLAAQARNYITQESWTKALDEVMADYHEPVPGAAERIRKALQIMLTAWFAAKMRQKAETMLAGLETPSPQ